MINYNNPSDDEIRRIVKEAHDAGEQKKILHHFTGKSVDELRQICGMPKQVKKRHYGRGRPKHWDEQKIKYLYDHPNETAANLAKHLGVSENAVTSMRYQLRIKRVSIWTDELLGKLIKARKCGMTPTKIALLLDTDGITPYEVQKKIISMKNAKKL